MKTDYFDKAAQQFANLMIEKIQQVEDNWQKPWITIAANTRNFFPQNLTGRRYTGGNAFLLLFLCEKFQYQTPVFMTFNQAKEAGISVLKGSKSFPVYYFLFYVYHKETRKKITFEEYKALSREQQRKYSINSLVYWVTYVHNVVYSFYRSMIYCYINSTQRCAGSIVIDIIPTNGADKRKFFPFAPYFPVTNVIKRYFYPYFPAIIGIKGYSFPYFPYLSGIMKIKTALYSLFSRLDWHKTVVFPCLGEIYEGIRSLSWEIPVT